LHSFFCVIYIFIFVRIAIAKFTDANPKQGLNKFTNKVPFISQDSNDHQSYYNRVELGAQKDDLSAWKTFLHSYFMKLFWVSKVDDRYQHCVVIRICYKICQLSIYEYTHSLDKVHEKKKLVLAWKLGSHSFQIFKKPPS